MTLDDYKAMFPCDVIRTLDPPKDVRRPTFYVVAPWCPMHQFEGEAFFKLDDDHWVAVTNHPTTWSYEVMPRFWRERLFPHMFREGAKTSLTPAMQANVDFQKRVWEQYHDRQLTLEQARQIIADCEPLPNYTALFKAGLRAMTARVRPVSGPKPISRDREAALLDLIRKPEPEEPAA